MLKRLKNNWPYILLPLLAGVLVYVLFREPVTGLHRLLGLQSRPLPLPDTATAHFFRFHFPDMCWAFALFATLWRVTGLSKTGSATITLVLLSFTEWEQASFRWAAIDWADIGWMTLAVFIAFLIIPNEKKN